MIVLQTESDSTQSSYQYKSLSLYIFYYFLQGPQNNNHPWFIFRLKRANAGHYVFERSKGGTKTYLMADRSGNLTVGPCPSKVNVTDGSCGAEKNKWFKLKQKSVPSLKVIC